MNSAIFQNYIFILSRIQGFQIIYQLSLKVNELVNDKINIFLKYWICKANYQWTILEKLIFSKPGLNIFIGFYTTGKFGIFLGFFICKGNNLGTRKQISF